MSLRKKLKQILRGKAGLFLTLRPPRAEYRLYEPEAFDKLVLQMQLHGIDLVYDIGANKGQFGGELMASGYKGKLVSFEPLSSAHGLLAAAARSNPRWTVAPRCAVGAEAGSFMLNISENSFASSLMTISETALAGAPSARFVGQEETPVITLDSTTYDLPGAKPFIKVDTQGFELEVLKGATRLLDKAVGLQLEMSFAPMYEQAPDFETLYGFLRQRGFVLWGMDTAFRDPKSRRLYQVDATFFRSA